MGILLYRGGDAVGDRDACQFSSAYARQAVLGFNNIDYCRICTPRLSSVDLDAKKLSARAVTVLLGHIRESLPGPVREYVPFSIVERETT
jgi:DNA-binding LacI/PurR family transcriptional regulator